LNKYFQKYSAEIDKQIAGEIKKNERKYKYTPKIGEWMELQPDKADSNRYHSV
jgi:hypothetical protein